VSAKSSLRTIAMLTAAAVAVAGCASEGAKSGTRTSHNYNDMYFPPMGGQQAAKPAPAAVKVAAPAPAPAPAKTGCGGVLFYPTGMESTSALKVEKSIPCEIVSGQCVDYWIKVSNLTGMTLDNVQVTDTISSNFNVKSSDPAGTTNAGVMVWNLGSMAAHSTKTIKINGCATGDSGNINACGNVSYSSSVCAESRIVKPALKLAKSEPAEVSMCDVIPVKLVVTNNGTGPASNVKVKDMLPEGWTADGKTGTLEFDAGTLAPGASKDFAFNAKPSKTGSFTNKSMAMADGGLSADASASTVVKQAKLEIAETCDGKVVLGRDYGYQITVTNTGDTDCAGTTLEATIPSGTSFVSATDGGTAGASGVTWNIGSLAPKASKKVGYTVKPGAAGNFKNTATVKCACATPASTTCSTDAIGIPAMLLDGVDDPDPVPVGGTTTYTLKVTNQGFEKLTNVTLVLTLDDPKVMTYVSNDSNGTQNGVTVSFPAIPVLGVKESKTYKLVVKAAGEGQVQVKAEAKSNEITRTLIKTETTNFYK